MFFFKGLTVWILPFSAFHKFLIISIFNLCWTTVFLEIWKRKSSELSYLWGILDVDLIDEQRPQFRGTPSINPVTKKQELYYSKYDLI